MAESTLHETFSLIRAGVGAYLGLDATVGNWLSADVAAVEEYMRCGYKQALYPPMGEDKTPYEWSFLTPTNTLSVSSGTSTYDLPANFDGGIDTVILTTGGTTPRRLEKVSADMLDATRIREAAATATPVRYAIRPKTPTTTSGATADLTSGAGQRWEIIFYPTPNATFTATIRYPLSLNALTATNIYSLGGPLFSDLVLASCLMVAAMRVGMPDAAMHAGYFKERLVSAIVHDRRLAKEAEDIFPVTTTTIGSYDWLAQEVGRALQISANQGVWSYSDAERVRSVISQGLMQFYQTPPDGHRWSFLESNTTLTTVAPYSTGTVTIASGVVTGSGTTFPASWAADGEIAVGGYSYSVATYTSATSITLDDTTLTITTAADYVLFKPAYALPSTFSAIDTDPLTFQPGAGHASIKWTRDVVLRDKRVNGETYSFPQLYSIRPTSASTSGTAYEIAFWPIADAIYQLSYRPRVVPVMLSSGQTPLGGLDHSLTILASCLAIIDPKSMQLYMQRLQQSVLSDRAGHTPGNLGYNGDRSDDCPRDRYREELEPWNSALTSLNL